MRVKTKGVSQSVSHSVSQSVGQSHLDSMWFDDTAGAAVQRGGVGENLGGRPVKYHVSQLTHLGWISKGYVIVR